MSNHGINNDPDQIDMMNEHELRRELRKQLRRFAELEAEVDNLELENRKVWHVLGVLEEFAAQFDDFPELQKIADMIPRPDTKGETDD